jgi:hypothetical protein
VGGLIHCKDFFKGTRALVFLWAPVLCIRLLYGSCPPGSDFCNQPRYCIVLNCTVLNLFAFVQEYHRLVQYSTLQHSTVQYSTVQCSTIQYSTVQYNTVQYSTVQYSTVHVNYCFNKNTGRRYACLGSS